MHDLLGVCMCVAFCCRLRSLQVVERVVEVEPDKAALVEQLRAQMKAEMEAQQEQQLQGQALEAARQEAEARARQQLEVGSASWVMCVGSFDRLHLSACTASMQMYENQAEHERYTPPAAHGLSVHYPDVVVLPCCLQSLMTASNATEEQRLALREALKGQIANMRALQAAAEKDKQEQQELLARIAAMEGKVCCVCTAARELHGSQCYQANAVEARPYL